MSTPVIVLLCLLLGAMTGPVIMTPPVVARRWHCKADAVRELCEAGLLKAFKVGRKHWRVTLEAVEAFERGERQPATPAAPRRKRQRPVVPDGPF